MYKSPSRQRQSTLFWNLKIMLDRRYPLFKLANLTDCSSFEAAFSPLLSGERSSLPRPIHLMVGLLIWMLPG